jgi:hypothetical protein
MDNAFSDGTLLWELKPSWVHSFMRILVQHKGTGLYVTDEGTWHKDFRTARDFASTSSASEFCRERGLQDVHIALKFEGGLIDITLPLD